jgi:hypothetical protein
MGRHPPSNERFPTNVVIIFLVLAVGSVAAAMPLVQHLLQPA